jgi:hypothetical protein
MTDPLRAAIDRTLTDPDRTVRREVESLLVRLLADQPGAVVEQPAYPGATYSVRVPAPLAGVALALQVQRVAHRLAREHATQARAAGYDWLEIATAAGLEPTAEPSERAAAAFSLTAGPPARLWDEQVVWWQCPSCGQGIRDTGPDAGRGDDETGHAPTCQRRLSQLAAWAAEDAAADLDDRDLDEDFDDETGWDADGEHPDNDDAADWNPDAPLGFR